MEPGISRDIADWMLHDLHALSALLVDGRLAADLTEIGNTLCDADDTRLRALARYTVIDKRVVGQLHLVLPYYLPLLRASIERHGEEGFLTEAEFAHLFRERPSDTLATPKLVLESGARAFALMQAAVALAGLDDYLAGPCCFAIRQLLPPG